MKRKTKSRSRFLRWTLRILSVFILLIVIAFGSLYFLDPYGLRIAPAVSIGGLDVSGMTIPEARTALSQALEETLYSQEFLLSLPCGSYRLSPDDTQPNVDVTKAVVQAFQYSRTEEQPENDISLLPFLSIREDHIRSLLLDYAEQYDTELTEFSWSVTGEIPNLQTDAFDPDSPAPTLSITLGMPEQKLDVEDAVAEILGRYRQAISTCENRPFGLVYDVPVTQSPKAVDLNQIRESVCLPAVNDSLDMETYAFVPGSYGVSFSQEDASTRLRASYWGDTISLPLSFHAPEILGETAYYQEVLGACETRHNNNENRNTNLRLLCAALDGHVVQPGETFSYNEVLGERTREKGYLPAPAYSGDRLVDSIGGGVCQGSTTLYNCVLLADLEVVERACHGASVGYVPAGLDAAVNYLTTDFRFRNNFHFPVKIHAEVSDGYVKMKLLGTDEKDYYIKMESRSGDDDIATYARSYKCKYSKETDQLISREIEAFSTYYKNIG